MYIPLLKMRKNKIYIYLTKVGPQIRVKNRYGFDTLVDVVN